RAPAEVPGPVDARPTGLLGPLGCLLLHLVGLGLGLVALGLGASLSRLALGLTLLGLGLALTLQLGVVGDLADLLLDLALGLFERTHANTTPSYSGSRTTYPIR